MKKAITETSPKIRILQTLAATAKMLTRSEQPDIALAAEAEYGFLNGRLKAAKETKTPKQNTLPAAVSGNSSGMGTGASRKAALQDLEELVAAFARRAKAPADKAAWAELKQELLAIRGRWQEAGQLVPGAAFPVPS